MKSLKISLVIGILIYTANSLSGQNIWPLMPLSQQHNITGTYGECRFTGSDIRFHQGVDMINGTNYNVYAIHSGFLTIVSSSRVVVTNSEGIKDSYVHVKGNSFQNNTWVTAGTQIGTMIIAKPIHLHLESRITENLNMLAHRIGPYTDVAPPQITGFSIRQNGHTYQNNATAFPENYIFQGQSHRIIYNKVDFVATVKDVMAGTCAPSRISYNVKDYQDISVSNGDVFNINFEQAANDAAARYCFGYGTSISPAVYNYVLTANPRTTPYDRYFNTGLRTNTTETWPNTTTLDARNPGEARYPDGKYMVRVDAWDVDLDYQNNMATKSYPVIIDNFLPYIQKVEVRKDNAGGSLNYRAMWEWNGQTMTYSKPIDIPMVNPTSVIIRIYSSEPMLDIFLQAGSFSGAIITPVAATNFRQWEITLPAAVFDEGSNCLNISGHDFASNQLYGLLNTSSLHSSNFPLRLANGNWSLYSGTITDKVHCFSIEEPVAPEAAFIPLEITVNPGDNVHFTDISTNQPYQWDWAFDGGDPAWSSDQDPVITYNDPGTYVVVLYVMNAAGVASCTGVVHVSEDVVSPIASFAPDNLSITPGTSISFVDGSSGNPTQWVWDFDGAAPPSFDQNPVVEFDQEGTFEISLSVSNAAGVSLATGTVEVSIYNEPLDIMCMVNPFMGVIGTTVNLSASVINGSPPFQYFFDFGDGTYETVSDFSAFMSSPHTYNQNGDYLQVVLITDSEGRSSSCQEQVTIYGGDPCSTLNPNFTAASGNFAVAINSPCTFSDLSYGGTQPYWYYWTFGPALEGGGVPNLPFSTMQNPVPVVYNVAGNYPVTLHINDNAGCQGSVTKIIRVFLPEHCLIAKIGSGDDNYTQMTTGPVTFWDFSKLVSDYACSSPPGSGIMPCETDAVWNLYSLPNEALVGTKHTHPMDPAFCAMNTVNDLNFTTSLNQPGKYRLRLNIWDANCMVQSGYDCKDMDEVILNVIDCEAEITICQFSLNTHAEEIIGKNITLAGPSCNIDYWYGADILYTANKEIRLLEGFYAHEGAFVNARIRPCPGSQQTYQAPFLQTAYIQESAVEAWPNPCSSRFTLSGLSESSVYRLEMMDAGGRIVFAGEFTGNRNPEIKLPDLPAGIYSLLIRSDADAFSLRLAVCNDD